MLKKIFGSRIFRLVFSLILIYFAFRKVNVIKLYKDIQLVPLWFVLLNIFISFFLVFIISFRWSLLLFPKIKFKTLLVFTRANFLASFYSLFFPTAVAGDILKWLAIDSKYPDIPKNKVLGSVILDRFIGISVFMTLGFLSVIIGKYNGLVIPDYVSLILFVMVILFIVIYVLIGFFDVSKILPKMRFLNKLKDAFDLLKNKNKGQIVKCIMVSLFSEMLWISQIWLVGWKCGTNLEFLSIFVFIPIISMVLILPISIGGFGAREQLYLFFFSQVGSSNESILLMSTFLGSLGVVNALFGGALLFFDQKAKEKIKT
jgi:uncharacterized membrane protein YbhN (UPF0104 family)